MSSTPCMSARRPQTPSLSMYVPAFVAASAPNLVTRTKQGTAAVSATPIRLRSAFAPAPVAWSRRVTFTPFPEHSSRARHARPVATATPSPAPETPADVVPPPPPPPMQPPPGALQTAETLGAAKAAMPFPKVFLLGVLAGAYIAIAAVLALSVGGAVPELAAANPGLQKILFGAIGLPFGLTMVLTAGGELFTGNTALVTAAWLAGRASFGGLMRNWIASFAGNFVGSLLVVWLVASSGVLVGPSAAAAIAIAKAKTSLTFGTAFARGIACNWLVCLAVWLASSARDMGGKFISVLLPISAFVAIGFDHSIANMFLIPMGMKAGASAVTIKSFLVANLLPVTLGNIVGGAVLVAAMYHIIFGKSSK